MPKVKDKLAALKQGVELPVDLQELATERFPDTDEKAVLELATALQEAEKPDYVVVSWACQEKAAQFFNEHGLRATLDKLFELQRINRD